MKSIIKYIDCYKKNRAKRLKDELNQFAERCSITKIVKKAALSENQNGMHPHQCRVGKEKLTCKSEKLSGIEKKIDKKLTDFDKLHTLIENAKVTGVGKLANYDIALRISWYLHYVKKVKKILPEKVYLHSGTREGARILVRKNILEVPKDINLTKDESLDKKYLKIFGKLEPYQIEDFLCVCKGCFGGKNGRSKCCPKNCSC